MVVGEDSLIPQKVAEVYEWLESQIAAQQPGREDCNTCGRCCDFENFDHKLFVTPPELIYLSSKLNGKPVKPMSAASCPYNKADGKCEVYPYRFAGCRIFCCKTDPDFQSKISELTLAKLKSICTDFQIAYLYRDLATALNNLAGR
jgi:hypothetical protein